MPVISALGRLKQENHDFEVSLGKKKKRNKKEKKGGGGGGEEEEILN
jgi:hypothetical protein